MAGYDADVCDYTNLGDEYDPRCNFLPLRVTAAAFGVATVPLLYWAVRLMGLGRWGAILTSILFTFDMLNLIESRLILTDSQLMFWIVVCLLTGMRYFQAKQEHAAAEGVVLELQERGVPRAAALAALQNAEVVPGAIGHLVDGVSPADTAEGCEDEDLVGPAVAVQGAYARRHLLQVHEAEAGEGAQALRIKVAPWAATGAAPRLLSRQDNLLWAVVLGLACGASVSVKWTGLGTPGLIALETWLAIFVLRDPVHFFDMLVMLASAFLFYLSNYYIHFALLPNTGDGDAFMPIEFQRTLVGNEHYDPQAPHPGFLRTFFTLAWEMLSGNARIDQRHNWESTWDQWILNKRGVLYHSNTTEPVRGRTESVYLIGNPAVIWLVAVVVALALLYVFFHYRCRAVRMVANSHVFRNNRSTLALVAYCLVGYFCNLLPYLGVERSCFAYHYMPALLYGEILAGVLLERFFGKAKGAAAAVQYISLGVMAVFVFYMPWIYSLPLTPEGHEQRRWLKTWN